MNATVLAVRPEGRALAVTARGTNLAEELAKRRYSLREFGEFIGVKSPGHVRNIVLGVSAGSPEVRAKVKEFLEAVCPHCGCKCPPNRKKKA
jgi:hypothetical protein